MVMGSIKCMSHSNDQVYVKTLATNFAWGSRSFTYFYSHEKSSQRASHKTRCFNSW